MSESIKVSTSLEQLRAQLTPKGRAGRHECPTCDGTATTRESNEAGKMLLTCYGVCDRSVLRKWLADVGIEASDWNPSDSKPRQARPAIPPSPPKTAPTQHIAVKLDDAAKPLSDFQPDHPSRVYIKRRLGTEFDGHATIAWIDRQDAVNCGAKAPYKEAVGALAWLMERLDDDSATDFAVQLEWLNAAGERRKGDKRITYGTASGTFFRAEPKDMGNNGVIIVEGGLDAMSAAIHGWSGLALGGAHLHSYHRMHLIRVLRDREQHRMGVVGFLDNNPAGLKLGENLASLASRNGDIQLIISPEPNQDLTDLTLSGKAGKMLPSHVVSQHNKPPARPMIAEEYPDDNYPPEWYHREAEWSEAEAGA